MGIRPEIYLDNSATTKISPVARGAMLEALDCYGNPSSLHKKGAEAARLLTKAREAISRQLSRPAGEIYFNSGGSEGNNTALVGLAQARQHQGKRILVTASEHPSLLEPAKFLAQQGFEVQFIPVLSSGLVDLAALESLLDEKTTVIALHQVNNETGTIQQLEIIGKLVKQKSPSLIHIDGVQGLGRLPLRLDAWKADSYSASGHKIHGPKGVGFLWLRRGVRLPALIKGGGQENELRSGTENLPGIWAMAAALTEICTDREENTVHFLALQDILWEGLQDAGALLNSNLDQNGAPHILNVSFPGVKSEVLLHYLEQEGIYVSSGSACSSKKRSRSPVLHAMGLSPARIESAIRYSFCPNNTLAEAERAAGATVKAVREIRQVIGKL